MYFFADGDSYIYFTTSQREIQGSVLKCKKNIDYPQSSQMIFLSFNHKMTPIVYIFAHFPAF